MISTRDDYRGFQGLNTKTEHFSNFVMGNADIRNLLGNQRQFKAVYAYPPAVADAFELPPEFSASDVDINGLLLRASNHTNETHTHSCLTFFAAKVILPEHYFVNDRIDFAEDADNGFGPGTCRITTASTENDDGTKNKCLTRTLAVTNRPALFLKIQHEDGSFYHNAAIFFPAQASGFSHRAVKHGEAFVLAEKGKTMPETFAADVKRTFDLLVKESYGEKNGLRSIPDYRAIEDDVRAVPGAMI